MNNRKPMRPTPITPRTRATISSGRWRLNTRHREHPAGQHQHPQQQRSFVTTPGRRKTVNNGNSELELLATLSTEKSLLMKE